MSSLSKRISDASKGAQGAQDSPLRAGSKGPSCDRRWCLVVPLISLSFGFMTPQRKPICDDENIHAHSTPFSWAVARLWRMWLSREGPPFERHQVHLEHGTQVEHIVGKATSNRVFPGLL